MSYDDWYWMAECIKLARRGQYSTHPNPAVGCLIVKGDHLLSSGWHQKAGEPHAEIMAIQSGDIPPGCDFYVTLLDTNSKSVYHKSYPSIQNTNEI